MENEMKNHILKCGSWLILVSLLASSFVGITRAAITTPKYLLLKANQNAIYVDGNLQKLCSNSDKYIQLDEWRHGFAPAKCLAEAIHIESEGARGKVTFHVGKDTIKVTAKQREYKLNKKTYKLSYAPYMDGKTLYISLRDMARLTNYKVIQLSGVYVFTRLKDGPTASDVSKAIVTYENKQIKIPVLTYHHFSTERTDNSLIVHPDLFDQQMKYIHDQGYTSLSDEDLAKIYAGQMDIPEKPILITLDDGYESNYNLAYPILKKYNLKATIFLIVRRIYDQHREILPYNYLDWQEIKEMSDSGLISFQSHTYNMHFMDPKNNLGAITHPMSVNGKVETDDEYDQRVLNDLALSKSIIEQKLGKKVVSFAYPFGHYNKHTEELVKQAGFQFSFSVKSGSNALVNGPYLLRRASVPGVIKVGMSRIPASFDSFPDFLKRVKEKG
jgi:peptidoglycan/xylan/chitin deacetylase (PgdA/CDA1 family)